MRSKEACISIWFGVEAVAGGGFTVRIVSVKMIVRFIGVAVAVYVLSGLGVAQAVQEDEWLTKPPDTRFQFKQYVDATFSKEENVTWDIQGDLRSIRVQRRSWIYTLDTSAQVMAIKHDHLTDIKVTIYSAGVKVLWKFTFEKEHVVIQADDKIEDSVIVEVNGTLAVHSEGSFQVGFSIDPETAERDYFAYTSIYPYRCSELFPGVEHNRQTNVRLKILFPDDKYTVNGRWEWNVEEC